MKDLTSYLYSDVVLSLDKHHTTFVLFYSKCRVIAVTEVSQKYIFSFNFSSQFSIKTCLFYIVLIKCVNNGKLLPFRGCRGHDHIW